MGRTYYALELLRHYSVRPRIIVFTHPHLDHARGVAQLVDAHTSTPHTSGSPWPLLGLLLPSLPGLPGSTIDPQAYNERAAVLNSVNAICDRWKREPATRWSVQVGDQRQLGSARVTVLSPEANVRADAKTAWEQGQDYDWNQAATALLIEWEGRQLVLGSDLVEKPGHGWSRAMARFTGIANHVALKVAHHGSSNAQDKGLLARPSGGATPRCLLTPFATEGLPRFGKREGVIAEVPPAGDPVMHYGPGSVVVSR